MMHKMHLRRDEEETQRTFNRRRQSHGRMLKDKHRQGHERIDQMRLDRYPQSERRRGQYGAAQQHLNRVLDKVVDTLESNPLVEVGEVALEMF